jgi:proline dehydrogenase
MLRSFLIYLSKANWAKRTVTNWKFAWRAASRFIAGEKLEDAIRVVKELNQKNIYATLDHLGELTSSPEKAVTATQDILRMLAAIDQAGVKANVSIKLTQIGLALDEDLCIQNLRTVLETSKKHNTFIRIDMEDSQWVDKTLAIYRLMRGECGCDNIGVVIQSYLYRSEKDIESLLEDSTRIRLCKGAYKEPADIAFPRKRDVDINYDLLASKLIDGASAHGAPEVSPDGKIPPIPAIATHDEKRISFAKAQVQKAGLPRRAVEFQMLHGIRRDLQENLSKEGFPVRVYVPYGSEWYPYFTRRLAERPANLWFFISNFFRQ